MIKMKDKIILNIREWKDIESNPCWLELERMKLFNRGYAKKMFKRLGPPGVINYIDFVKRYGGYNGA